MKKLSLVIAFLFSLNLGYGGGDISIITDYETQDEYSADNEASEELYEESGDIITSPEEIIDEPQEDEDLVVEEEPVVIDEAQEDVVVPTPTPTPISPLPPSPVVSSKRVIPNGLYVGLGISGARYKDSCYCNTPKGKIKVENKDKTLGVIGRVGYDFNQYVGVEVRGIKTNWKSDGAKVSHLGAFLKPMVPVSNNTNIYGLVGVAKTKTTGSMPNVDTTALALGAGVEIDLSADTPQNGKYNREFDGAGDQESGFGLFLDYERMVVKKDAPTLDSISAGLTYDF